MKINFERIKYSPFGDKIFGGLIPTVAALTFGAFLSALCVLGFVSAGKKMYIMAV